MQHHGVGDVYILDGEQQTLSVIQCFSLKGTDRKENISETGFYPRPTRGLGIWTLR